MSIRRKLAKLFRDPEGFVADARVAERTSKTELFDMESGEQLPRSARDKYLYLPWLPGHGEALLSSLDARGDIFLPWRLFRSPERLEQRSRINHFARTQPEAYRRLLLRSLAPALGAVRGMVFTLDWPPAMRQAVYACRELGIPTLLVPHESVFADRSRYYVDRHTLANTPACDHVLCWGHLQQAIFIERGYPAERTTIVGSPKLDAAIQYRPILTRELFAQLYTLDPDRKFVLFAMQPLDSQFDAHGGRSAQNRAVRDLINACEDLGAQLVVRFPPGGHRVLNADTEASLRASPHARTDDGPPYLTGALESIHHANAVVSINSTMLLEAGLMGRCPVSARYLEFGDLWSAAGIPSARNAPELHAQIRIALERGPGLPDYGLAWAANAFSCGTFDGKSGTRIKDFLDNFGGSRAQSFSLQQLTSHLRGDSHAIARHGTAALFKSYPTEARALEAMLGFPRTITAWSVEEAQVADVFVEWAERRLPQGCTLNRPRVRLEAGFLGTGQSYGPPLSVRIDITQTSERSSWLRDRLEGELCLTAKQRVRTRHCLDRIIDSELGECSWQEANLKAVDGAPQILLVQWEYGSPDGRGTMSQMLVDAQELTPNHHLLLWCAHPGSMDSDALRGLMASARVTLVGRRQLSALVPQVQAVWTDTSPIGMQALIMGVPVRCYGAPFYAGWGLTQDVQPTVWEPQRAPQRSLEDLFHVSYIEGSRYFLPTKGACEIEDVISYLANRRTRRPD